MRRLLPGFAVRLAAVAALAGIAAPSLEAQPAPQERYPSRPIRLHVPFPAGGPFDTVPRIVLQDITDNHGWNFVVENRGGADGQIGVQAAKRTTADGYNLLAMSSISHAAAPAYRLNLGYDAINDFVPIVLLADASMALLVNKNLPASSVAEMVALLKAQPGKLNFGSGGHSSQHFFATAMFFHRAGLPHDIAAHVPFPGMAPALQALLAGSFDFMFGSGGPAAQNIETGIIRALAQSSDVRSPRLPNVPTMAEAGYPGFKIVAWVGLAAPAGTPREVIDLVAKLANEAMAKPAVRQRISAIDYEVRGGSPEAFAAFVKADIAQYNKLIDDLKLPRR